MTVVLTADQVEIIQRGMRTGLYPSEEAVIVAASESLAENWQDSTVIQERSSKALFPLASVEADLQREGRLD